MIAISSVPVAVVLVPIGGAVVVYLAGLRWRNAAGPFAAILLAVTFVLCVWIAGLVLGGKTILAAAEGHFLALRVDALSGLLLIVIGLLGLLSALFSLAYLPKMIAQGHGRAERFPMYYALLTLFVGTMVWACCTNNIIILWIAVEATTLASALLVAFYWDRPSLEAGYKYLLLLTVGITFALFGCVLLYAAATGLFSASEPIKPMLISEITQHAASLVARAPTVLAMAIIFLVVGFGTKTGFIPFHAWLPDAHASAPSPVSALLSGILIKMGAYALLRTTAPFLMCMEPLSAILVTVGALTMLVGIAAAAVQNDVKRLLAYSSVSQLGYVVMGFGIGTYLGLLGGLFHLVNHALAKALLFFSAGSVEYGTGQRSLSRLGGIQRVMPASAVCFFVGALSLGGVPGLNGFLSKLTIFLAAADRQLWLAALAAIVTGLLTLIVLTRAAVMIFWGEERAAGSSDSAQAQEAQPTAATVGAASNPGAVAEAPGLMVTAMVVLAILCVLLGVWPPLANTVVMGATQAAMTAVQYGATGAGAAVASLP